MAQLALSVAGAVVGTAIGIGPQAGWAIGSAVGSILGLGSSGPDIRNEGPHLTDTRVSPAQAGIGLPIGFGTDRYTGTMIWLGKRPDGTRGIIEVTNEEVIEGGKGTPTVTNITYTGRASWATAFAEGPASQVIQVWADSKCVFDSTGTESEVINLPIKWYMGTDTQLPDPTMEASEGVGNVPGHTGVVYAVFDWPLEQFGNHIPNITAKITFNADQAFPYREITGFNFAPDIGSIVIDPSRPYLYVRDNDNIARVNTQTGEVEQQVAFDDIFFGNVNVYGNRVGIDASGRLYVNYSVFGGSHSLMGIIDGLTLSAIATELGKTPLFPHNVSETVANCSLGYTALQFGGFCSISHPILGDITCSVAATGGGFGTKGTTAITQVPIPGVIPGFDAPTIIAGFLPSIVGGVSVKNSTLASNGTTYFWNVDSQTDGTHTILKRIEFRISSPGGGLSWNAYETLYNITDYVPDGISYCVYYAGDHSLILDGASATYKIDIANLEAGFNPLVTSATGVHFMSAEEAARGIASDGTYLAGTSIGFKKVDAHTLTVVKSGYDETDFVSTGALATDLVYDPKSNSAYGVSAGTGIRQFYLDRFSGNGVSLASVVRAISQRVGLNEPKIDVDNLEPYIVRGFSIKTPTAANACLRYLADSYFFDGVEEDFKVKFPLRGGDPVRTLTEDDLGAELGEQRSDNPQPLLNEPRTQDKELPRTLYYTFIDPDRNYDQNTAPAKREAAIVASSNDVSVDCPVVFTFAEGKNIAWRHLFLRWIERYALSGTLMPMHRDLSPADVVTFQYHGVNITARLTQLTDDFVMKFQALADRAAVYVNPGLLGDGGTGFNPPPIPNVSTAVELFLLDTPLLSDAHQSNGGATGVYLGVGSYPTSSGGSTSGSGSSGGSTVTDGQGEPVVGDPTTLSFELAHNISAYSDYNSTSANAEVQLNFSGHYVADGVTHSKSDLVYDDSLNAVTPANVSKLPVKSLLYSGATTKFGVHLMPWAKNPKTSHINFGYNSNDQTQVNAQIADMKSRGMEWLAMYWTGQGGKTWSYSSASDTTAVLGKVKTGCEALGYEFCVSLNHLTIKNASDKQAALISEIRYLEQNFAGSSKWLRYNGRPILMFFGLEAYASQINWKTVRANTTANWLFIGLNSGDLSPSAMDGESNGSRPWPATSGDTPSDPANLKYLTNFYNTAKANPGQVVFGGGWLGFNGTLTADPNWSLNKHISQQNGLTLLQTIAKVNSYYSSSNQLPFFMFATWNDYEEGTALELGVENNISITASMSTNTLNWSISGGTGDAQTINHYTVMYGTDGANFTYLNNFATSTTSLDLSSAMSSLPSATYKLRVIAYGKPCIRNKVSNEVTWVKP